MKFVLTLDMDHEAFRALPMKSISRALRDLAIKIDQDSWAAMQRPEVELSDWMPSQVGTYQIIK